MDTLVPMPGVQHAQILYRAAEDGVDPGVYRMPGKLWRHRNEVWYVLYGPRLKKRISTRSKDRATAAEFYLRFFKTDYARVSKL